jgi:hypothetical protein
VNAGFAPRSPLSRDFPQVATAQEALAETRNLNEKRTMANFTTNNPIGKLAGFLVAVLMLTGCFAEKASGPDLEPQGKEVALKVRMGIGSVNSLRKSQTITLSKLIVVLTSSANDTIRDTITSLTTPALNPVSTTGQTVQKNYALTALRAWQLIVTSRDSQDSVIHIDTGSIPAMYAGDTAVVNLNLSSRFTMYEAKFLSLPDSIQSATPNQPKQVLCINRLVLKIDGLTVRDSTSSPCFDSLATHALTYDYVAVGNRSVQMIAYGPMNYWDVANPLFSGDTTINVGSGADATVGITLDWVGPTTGTGKIEVELGKVGKVTVNGTLPGTVF